MPGGDYSTPGGTPAITAGVGGGGVGGGVGVVGGGGGPASVASILEAALRTRFAHLSADGAGVGGDGGTPAASHLDGGSCSPGAWAED